MKSATIVILVVVVVGLVLVALNRYHHSRHHYNVDKLAQFVKDVLATQPERMMRREDFVAALQCRYNCHRKEALWLMGYAREHNLIKADEKWVELKR